LHAAGIKALGIEIQAASVGCPHCPQVHQLVCRQIRVIYIRRSQTCGGDDRARADGAQQRTRNGNLGVHAGRDGSPLKLKNQSWKEILVGIALVILEARDRVADAVFRPRDDGVAADDVIGACGQVSRKKLRLLPGEHSAGRGEIAVWSGLVSVMGVPSEPRIKAGILR